MTDARSMTVAVRRADVREVLEAALPEWRGRRIRVVVTERVRFARTNWDGGTRSTYVALTLARVDGAARVLRAPAPWSNPIEGLDVAMRPGCIIVEHAVFCGHDAGVTIYSHPDNAPRLLGAARERRGAGRGQDD